MIFQRSLAFRFGVIRQAYVPHLSGSEYVRPFHAVSHMSQNSYALSAYAGLLENFKADTNIESSTSGNLAAKLGLGSVNVSSPYSMSFKSYIHSGQVEVEAGRIPRSMDYVKGLFQENANAVTGRPMDLAPGLFQENGYGVSGRRSFYQPQLETNADIVHIKLMRNNAFVTVTDSKGNKKKGISAAKLAGKGGKLARYSGEAAAENMGREVRRMKTKSVVVKVNGFTFFRRKKDAILGFKDGYSNSRGDVSPIVYIEDTTRKPHNGCRRRKQRRI